jgi:hypothetical protein
MAKNFYDGTDIIAKHYNIILEEVLEFFMAPKG